MEYGPTSRTMRFAQELNNVLMNLITPRSSASLLKLILTDIGWDFITVPILSDSMNGPNMELVGRDLLCKKDNLDPLVFKIIISKPELL